MKYIKKSILFLLIIFMLISENSLISMALEDISGNEYIIPKKVPSGKTGKTMTISFTFQNAANRDLQNVLIGFSQSVDLTDDDDSLKYGYAFPFEVSTGTFDVKNIGHVKKDGKKTVSFTAKVRRDIPEGYYSVPFQIAGDDFAVNDEYINVWIKKSTDTTDDEDDNETVQFKLGENQSTPYGIYPDVLNFSINMRNSSNVTAQDVTVSMTLSKDKKEFPFDINDANYDRHYEQISANETVEIPYSMSIQQDVVSGYFPIKFIITYRESSAGELKTAEELFYVRIKNKEDDDDLGEFNENDRTKARLIVDGFETVPAEIVAGEPFELIIRMKNASASVQASNILFSLESEKVSDSAVFSTESGSSSIVVNQMNAGETTELRYQMMSKAGVDQRAYALTIHEKFDSPEFKNAEEKIIIDISVKQIPRLNVGTIEVMPDTISVGGDSNIMFPVNNMGKVTLYNVMATFEADSIQTAEHYIGNIKTGESSNVDVMLTAIAPTADDGKVMITISFEDENGKVSSEVKELTLYVLEENPTDFGEGEWGEWPEPEAEPTFIKKYGWILAGSGVATGTAAFVAILKWRRKKKAQLEEGLDDEIS